MKRWLFTIVLFLLLGSVATLGISWFLAAGSIPRYWQRSGEQGHSTIGESGFWTTYRKDWFGRVRLRSFWIYEFSSIHNVQRGLPSSRDLTPEWAVLIKNVLPAEINNADVIAEATGWPLLAMRSHFELQAPIIDSSRKYEHPVRVPRGIFISNSGDLERCILPVQPIWPGFAINTLFYAAILWLLALAPVTARRMIRSKRGHCIKCGYDLRGAERQACPECGAGAKPATA